MGVFLQIIYQIGALLQLFTWGSVFLLQRASQICASAVHATCGVGAAHEGAAGNAPDADASASALGLGATGGAPAAGATPGT